jgi:hypothetical protein
LAKAKKDYRRITVEGVVYQYTISPNDGFISLIVRDEGMPKQKLDVAFEYDDQRVNTGDDIIPSQRLILPHIVRLAILEGLRQGWNPSLSRPGIFQLKNGDNLLPAEEWPRSQHA